MQMDVNSLASAVVAGVLSSIQSPQVQNSACTCAYAHECSCHVMHVIANHCACADFAQKLTLAQ